MSPSLNSPELFLKLMPVIMLLFIWDSVWKLIALWKSAQRKQLAWFICIAIFNTLGVLPIVYLALNKKTQQNQEEK